MSQAASEKTIDVYVKNTSNCPDGGMPLTFFTQLSQEWNGDELLLPFGEGDEQTVNTVVGWTDLFRGAATTIHVVKVRTQDEHQLEGYLVYGGNSGVRILDEEAQPIPGFNEHLPAGYGQPIIWVEDIHDLPEEVQSVVSQPYSE